MNALRTAAALASLCVSFELAKISINFCPSIVAQRCGEAQR